jgi:hypothetical protein
MGPTTIFTWGYYGSGNATPSLVEAVDAVETSRGFEPPFFVDIRIRRAVRAKGFQGSNFEKLLGPSRHRWMKSLGNKSILTDPGADIQIADPSAAAELLDLAVESAAHNQRVLFFCSCPWPRHNDEVACHRATVAGLVSKAAKKRGAAIEIVEWPGGDPSALQPQWQANEVQLNRLHTARGLDRELSAAEIGRLESEQDRIEWQLGFDCPGDADSRKWSGMA